jgi:MFS transporter, SP family, arabinose:H+ symporter
MRFVWLVSGVAAVGGLLFGFDTAVISGTIPYIKKYFQLNDFQLGWAVSSILIGCAVGAMFSGRLADRFGRKRMLVACAYLFALSGIGAGIAHQLWFFVLFRMIGGLGVGAAAMISPMYIAETAPKQVRGKLVALYQLAIVTGILLAYLTNYAFDSMGENNWRWMFFSQAIPSILFWCLLLLVPETPRWLVSKGLPEEALNVLNKINGQIIARQELAEIEKTYQEQTSISGAVSVKEVFSSTYSKVLIIGILIAVFQQITGINAVLYYAPVIFANTGLDSSSSLLQTIGIGLVNVAATFIAIGFVDKVGRKKFLLAGSAIMGLSLIGIAACFYYSYFEYYLVLIFILLYVASFGCTLGAVTWVYLSEIFPNRIRAVALSVATLTLWLADFVVTYTFPVMTAKLSTASTLFIYAGCCALAFVYTLIKVPETKGRSLEEMEKLFIK